MTNSKYLFITIVLALTTIFFAAEYIITKEVLAKTERDVQAQNINVKVLSFTKLFIEKVLKANAEIDFETRLALENGVRNLDNQAILDQWQKFTESVSEDQAQREVKNLLDMLVRNIQPE